MNLTMREPPYPRFIGKGFCSVPARVWKESNMLGDFFIEAHVAVTDCPVPTSFMMRAGTAPIFCFLQRC